MSVRSRAGRLAIATLLSLAGGCGGCSEALPDQAAAGTTAGAAATGGAGRGGAAATSGAGVGGAGAAADPVDASIDKPDSAIDNRNQGCEAISESWPDAELIRDGQAQACIMVDTYDGWSSGVPNPSSIIMRDELALTSPLAANQISAIALVIPGVESRTRLEVWGAADDTMCGAVDELLWYGDVEPRHVCMELTPSIDVRRLRLVWRALEPRAGLNADFSDLTICAGGSCLGDTSGTGRDGEPLELPPSGMRHYAFTAGATFAQGVSWELDSEGTFMAIWEDPATPGPIMTGFVHLPWDDELGDAWYCIGEDSTFILDDEVENRGEASLQGLSRLPECETGDGITSMTGAGVSLVVASSSWPELDMTHARPHGASCFGRTCTLYLAIEEENRFAFLTARFETTMPIEQTVSAMSFMVVVASAELVLVTDDGIAQRACASGGSIALGSETGEIKFELTGVGAPLSCPGEAALPSALSFKTGNSQSAQ
jgi:hypothetical protein